MAIIFRCMCGKKMQARDELAGRLMQCPICCYLFKIPGEGPGNFVRFTCGCGLKLKAYSFNAGEDVDCPGCGREQKIPAEVSRETEQLVAEEMDHNVELDVREASPVVMTEPEAAPWPEFAASPKSSPYLSANPMANDTLFVQHSVGWIDLKARGLNEKGRPEPRVRSRLLPLMVFAGVVLLFGGWVLGSQHTAPVRSGPAKIDELALVPTDTVGLVTVHFGSLWERHQLRKDSKAISLAQGLAIGLNWQDENIERVTLIWLPPESGAEPEKEPNKKAPKKAAKKVLGAPAPKIVTKDNYCLVVRATVPLIKEAVGPQLEKGGYYTSFAKRTYYRNTKGDLAVYVASDRTVVVSTVKGIEHFLRTQLWPGQVHPMTDVMATVGKNSVFLAFNFEKYVPAADDPGGKAIAEPGLVSAIMRLEESPLPNRLLMAELRLRFADTFQAKLAQEKRNTEVWAAAGKWPRRDFGLVELNFRNPITIHRDTAVLQYYADADQADPFDQFWTSLAAVVEKNLKLVPR